MADRIQDRWLRPRIVLPALLVIIVIASLFSPMGNGATGRYLSTRSRDLDGAAGLRDVLGRLGWKTGERVVPMSGELDTASTYVMLNTPVEPSRTEVHVLLEAVRRGARAIVVPERGGALADSIGVRTSSTLFANLFPTSDSLFGRSDSVPADSLRAALDILSARIFHRYLESTPATDSDTVGVWPSTARTLLFVRAKRTHPEITILPIGRGEVAAIGDPNFLRNDVLRRTAGAVLAVRVLENIDPTRSSTVVFDEFHQGYGDMPSLPDVIVDALVGTPWGRLALQLGLAGLLYLMMIGVRPIAPVSHGRLERRSPLEHVGALSRAYEAIDATSLAVQRLVRGVRRRHPMGAPANLSDADYLAQLKVRLPALAQDIDLLANALSRTPSTEQLVSAGAAIDHIERNFIT